MATIEQRVANLEAKARRWRSITLAILSIAALGCLMGQVKKEQKSIEAERVIFRDSAGHIRMELSSNPADGEIHPWFGLMFYNDDGKEVGRVRMSGNTPGIQLLGSTKDAVASNEEFFKKNQQYQRISRHCSRL